MEKRLPRVFTIDNDIRSVDDDGNDDDDGRARSGRLGRRVYSVIIGTVEIDGGVKSIDGSGGYVLQSNTLPPVKLLRSRTISQAAMKVDLR